jgi:hypothetical protein
MAKTKKRKETPSERITRLKSTGTLTIIVLGMFVCFVLMLVNPRLEMHAFQLLYGIIAAALGFSLRRA